MKDIYQSSGKWSYDLENYSNQDENNRKLYDEKKDPPLN